MADDSSPQTENTDCQITDTTQFQYPRLLIEASFESLLTHSQSTERGITIQMPRSEVSLSDSWSSLSEHDLSHEDDLHSEVTDAESLIDASRTDDVHTVDDLGDSSDIEDDEHMGADDDEGHVEAGAYDKQSTSTNMAKRINQAQHILCNAQDSVLVEKSTVLVNRDGTEPLQISTKVSDTEMRTSTASSKLGSSQNTMMTGSIEMSLSNENLMLGNKPYHILYYGSMLSSSEIRTDILGKIGAALISSDNHNHDDSAESPCYHVVPSEFGPGSKPFTADLIPIPTQMYVSDCGLCDTVDHTDPESAIGLRLHTGKMIISRKAGSHGSLASDAWRLPDLAIAVISQNELSNGRRMAQKFVEFANRHRIGLICLWQEAGWVGDNFLANETPYMLHKSIQHPSENGDLGSKMLLDVDAFLALDSELLNQHLNFLAGLADETKSAQSAITDGMTGVVQRFRLKVVSTLPQCITGILEGKLHSTQQRSRWITEVVTTSTAAPLLRNREASVSLLAWTSKERAFVLTMLSRIVMAIGIFMLTLVVVYSFQALGDYRIGGIAPAPSLTMTMGCSKLSTATSSAISLPSSTAKQTYALSAPLQALEQQVHNWIPNIKETQKKSVSIQQPVSKAVIEIDKTLQTCPHVIPAHLSPSLRVDAGLFSDGDPAFEVRVHRGKDRVSVKVMKQADGVAAVMIKRKDCHGKLTIHVTGGDKRSCALMNLEDSIGETLTLWIKSLRTNDPQLKSVKKFAKEFANEYTRIIVVRTVKPGLVNSAVELQYSAVRWIGAAVEAVEKTAIKHAKVCHGNSDECFIRKLSLPKDMIWKPAHQALQLSEVILRNIRGEVTFRTSSAKYRANEAAEQAKGEISKALHAIHSSINELSEARNWWPNRVASTLAEAQQRARRLVQSPGQVPKRYRGHR